MIPCCYNHFLNDVESCGKATAISFLTLYIISGSVVNLYDTLPVPRVSTSAQYGTIIGTLRKFLWSEITQRFIKRDVAIVQLKFGDVMTFMSC